MQVNVVGRHFDVTDAIDAYATKKTGNLDRYSDKVQQVETLIEKEKVEFKVEIVVAVAGHADIVARGHHEDLYACIDLVSDKAVRQLTDWNAKLKDHRG